MAEDGIGFFLGTLGRDFLRSGLRRWDSLGSGSSNHRFGLATVGSPEDHCRRTP